MRYMLTIITLALVAGCGLRPGQPAKTEKAEKPKAAKAEKPKKVPTVVTRPIGGQPPNIWRMWSLYSTDYVTFERFYLGHYIDEPTIVEMGNSGPVIRKDGSRYYTRHQDCNGGWHRTYLREADARRISDLYREGRQAGLKRLRLRVLVEDDGGLGFTDGHLVEATP